MTKKNWNETVINVSTIAIIFLSQISLFSVIDFCVVKKNFMQRLLRILAESDKQLLKCFLKTTIS